MRSSLDYAGFAQLCGRSPIMREIMRGLYLLINVDRIVSRQCEFIYGDVVMLTVISFSDHSRSTANTILSCSNLIYKRTQNKYKCVQLPRGR